MLRTNQVKETNELKPYRIEDWAGNLMNFGRFESWDDAEEYLCEKLGDNYETDRCEYYILKDGEK